MDADKETERKRAMIRRLLLSDNIKEQIRFSLLEDQDVFYVLEQIIKEYRIS